MGVLDGLFSNNSSSTTGQTQETKTAAEQSKNENSTNTTTGSSNVSQNSNTTAGQVTRQNTEQHSNNYGTTNTSTTGTSNTQANSSTQENSATNTSALTQATQQTQTLDAGTISALQSLIGGMASGGNIYSADTLNAIKALGGTATNMAGQAGTAQSEIQRAAEAAVGSAQNTFDTTTTGQINQYAQGIGGTENSAVMAIKAKAAGDLATQIAGIRANAAVAGRQAATSESTAAAGAQQTVAQLLASFDQGKTQNSAAIAQLADVLKGATTSSTGTTAQTGTSNTAATSNTQQSSNTQTSQNSSTNFNTVTDMLQAIGSSTNQSTSSQTNQNTTTQQVQNLISALTGKTAGAESMTGTSMTDGNSKPSLLSTILSAF
jgi:hypothetical protein